MKLFMLWDMEGVSGLHSRGQAWFWENGVSRETADEGRSLLIADVNAASAAALAAGVDELIVCDTHTGGGNIDPERMLSDPRVTYLYESRGMQDGKLRWMPGLDGSVDGFLVPGHHAKAGTPDAFMPHTWTGYWSNVRINGQSVGEMGIEACFAAHWDIPIIFAHGDTAACREAETLFPGIVTAPVKQALEFGACDGPSLEAAHATMSAKITEAVEALRAGRCDSFKPTLPMTVSISMTDPDEVAIAARRPNVRRVGDDTVECRVDRYCDVVNWIVPAGLDIPQDD